MTRQMARSIEVIEDLDAIEPDDRFRSTASFLDPLSAPMLAHLRRMVRVRFQAGNSRLLCARCGKPVYVSLSGAGIGEHRDGRDAFFAHHAGTAKACEWSTASQSPRDIDRQKFGGAGEGLQHQQLKALLAAMLEADPAFSSICVEHVISRPPKWRKPDVSAKFLGGVIAFDLQLATTQLPVIVAREEFYAQHGIRYVWVTSTNDAVNLAKQAFQDIYWNNNAQIFGIDGRAEAATRAAGELHIWVLSVAPRFDESGLRTVWERRLVPRSKIEWMTPTGRPAFTGSKFEASVRDLIETKFADARKRLLTMVRDEQQQSEAGRAWDEIAVAVGAPRWHQAQDDRAFKAIGVLATSAAGRKMDASHFPPDAMTAVFNDLLEAKSCRGWTTALQHVAAAHQNEQLLSPSSTRKKIARNLSEGHPALDRRYAAMLDILFPKSALARISGAPTEIIDAQ
ncbi:MAG TPA: DUF6035 family protein [Hyphomonas sp.]|nr:DUF6035 family protein [Hyphomonas sp.]